MDETRAVVEEIADERLRQVVEEGYHTKHDDEHIEGSIAIAAACYTLGEEAIDELWQQHSVVLWPWNEEAYKPKNKRRDLIRGAALIVAEIERIDRAEKGSGNE